MTLLTYEAKFGPPTHGEFEDERIGELNPLGGPAVSTSQVTNETSQSTNKEQAVQKAEGNV